MLQKRIGTQKRLLSIKQGRLITKKSGAANWDSKKIRELLKELSKYAVT